MSALVADGAMLRAVTAATPAQAVGNAQLIARLERLPVTPRLMLIRVIVGFATFFDGYTVLAIAFAMPRLVSAWGLAAAEGGSNSSGGCIRQMLCSGTFA